MNTAIITIKTPADIKLQAQGAAKELGFSLSSLINAYLRQLIKTKTVHFSIDEPSPFLVESLKESSKDIQNMDVSPVFESTEDAVAWLHDKKPVYEGKIQQKIQKTVR